MYEIRHKFKTVFKDYMFIFYTIFLVHYILTTFKILIAGRKTSLYKEYTSLKCLHLLLIY